MIFYLNHSFGFQELVPQYASFVLITVLIVLTIQQIIVRNLKVRLSHMSRMLSELTRNIYVLLDF